jgi:hypothetical protein
MYDDTDSRIVLPLIIRLLVGKFEGRLFLAKEKLLKTQNRKWLLGYIFANILLFSLIVGLLSPTFSDVESLFAKFKSPSGFVPLFLFPFLIVLEGILSSHMKYVLIFRRLRNPLPACQAFSKFAKEDPRVDISKFSKIFPEGLPKEPRDQNSHWYTFYRKYQNEPMVLATHRNFLLTRDLMTLSYLLIPVGFVAHLFWNTPIKLVLLHLGLLVFLGLCIGVSAKHYGERLVENVLVEATQ